MRRASRNSRDSEAVVQREIEGTPYVLFVFQGHDPASNEVYYHFKFVRKGKHKRHLVSSQPSHIRGMIKALIVTAIGFSRVDQGVSTPLREELTLIAKGLELTLSTLGDELTHENSNSLTSAFDEDA